jgi:hypothetical protein
MNWWAPSDEPVVMTNILDDTTAGKSAPQRWAREKEPKIEAAVRMGWSDESQSDNSRVGDAVVCKHRYEWRSRRSYPGTAHMEVVHTEL